MKIAAVSDKSDIFPVPQIDIANRNGGRSALFGLVAFRVVIPDDASEGSVVEARFGSVSRSFSIEEVTKSISNGFRTVIVHVNTHIFPNELTRFFMTIRLSGGESVICQPIVFIVKNDSPLGLAVTDDLRAANSPAIFGAIVDSRQFPYASGNARAPFIERPEKDIPLSFEPARDAAAAEDHLNRWGFTLLHETLPREMADAYIADLTAAIEAGSINGDFSSSNRIHGGHGLPSGRAIWLYPPVLEFLRNHFEDEPCACQTLTYLNGSEQNPHQDTIHLTPYPAGYMCGVWIALEDVRPDSGELVVYPGSHHAPRLRAADLGLEKVTDDYSSYAVFDARVRELMQEGGYERHVYRPQKGQILVWSENLTHGGSTRNDRSLTRKSIVSHYFARGAVAYYDSRGEAGSLESIV